MYCGALLISAIGVLFCHWTSEMSNMDLSYYIIVIQDLSMFMDEKVLRLYLKVYFPVNIIIIQ